MASFNSGVSHYGTLYQPILPRLTLWHPSMAQYPTMELFISQYYRGSLYGILQYPSIPLWNSLPENITEAHSLASFQRAESNYETHYQKM
ncbi:hypothetical protein DPMN_113144 [Dreissena polymorpha]|uniref:Uncharacterized protein n=1 Tax=Dreissena polymorpha TaxID=45954 RepID=A0A9D4KII6_DREPO|nr:hypothetical protein DPMN_113144 [Dreissena polymorpha]